MILLSSCQPADPTTKASPSDPPRLKGSTMGTTWLVRLGTEEPQATELTASIQSRLDELESILSHWDENSELSQINQTNRAAAVVTEISPTLAAVLQPALELSKISEGEFNIALGHLNAQRGFGPKHLVAPSLSQPRTAHELIILDGRQLRTTQPSFALDLSALAKGYAVDQITELLEESGHQNYLVEIGGEIRSLGRRSPDRQWTIGIQKPATGPTQLDHRRELPAEGIAIATSGNYRLYHAEKAGIHSHLVGPGAIGETTFRSVTVEHRSAMMADAWATLLYVAPRDRADALAKEHGIAATFLP